MIGSGNREPLKISFWGGDGPLPLAVFQALLAEDCDVTSMLVRHASQGLTSVDREEWMQPLFQPALNPADGDLPLLNPSVQAKPRQLAWQHEIPVYATGQPNRLEALSAVGALNADLVICTCYPELIPAKVLAVPRLGFLNVHPSRLPAYRGPAPLFWQLRDGITKIGVSIHLMSAAFDSGPLFEQTELVLPDGISGPDADRLLGETGGLLLASLLPRLADGAAVAVAQEGQAGYQGWPTDADFTLERSWSARRAYNFMRGTAEWGRPYLVQVQSEQVMLRRALRWSPARQEKLITLHGSSADIAFADGTLTATLA